jgi:Glycosyltransferase family 87
MPGDATDSVTSGTMTGRASEPTTSNQSHGGLSEEGATSRSLTSNTPYYVKALTLGIPAILIGIQLAGWVGFLGVIVNGHADFRQLYIAGYMVRTGHSHQLYDYNAQKNFQDALVSQEQIALPFNHLAYETLLFAAFSMLPFKMAYIGFLFFNVALLWVSFRLLRPRLAALAGVWPWLPGAIFISFLPVAAALMQGQDSILLLTLLAGAFVLLDQKRDLPAGALVALGLAKFQICLPIALLFLAWRKWRFCLGFALSAALVGAASLWIVGLAEAKHYVHFLSSMSFGLNTPAARFRYGISPVSMANLRGLIFGLTSSHLSASWVQMLTFALSAIVALWVMLWGRDDLRPVDALLVAITTSSLVSYHLLIHDLSILLVPVAIVLSRFIDTEGSVSGSRFILRAAVLMYVAPVCIAFTPQWFFIVALPLCAFLFALLRHIHSGGQIAFHFKKLGPRGCTDATGVESPGALAELP